MPSTRHLSAVTATHADDDGAILDASYPDTFLNCRSIQHDWRVIGAYTAWGEVVRALRCKRCGTDRHDHWSPSGHRMRGATYSYPDGYKIGGGGATTYEVRQEALRRMTIYESADALNAAIFGGKKRTAGAG